MKNYDDWKLDTPDNHLKPSGKECEECGYEIHIGEEYKQTNRGSFHYDCFDDFIEGLLEVRRKVAGDE
jgi:hypothetical protein